MTVRTEGDLGALWRGQNTITAQLTPQELRARAAHFELQTRRRYLRDQVSFGLVAAIFAGALFVPFGMLVRLGCALLLIWAVYGMYGLRRFGSVLRSAAEMSAQTCAVYHLLQLKRQRDVVLSWPLGMGLAGPGFLLTAVGYAMGPHPLPWSGVIALIGVSAFAYLATLSYGRILVGRWQEEIDSIVRLSNETGDKSISNAE